MSDQRGKVMSFGPFELSIGNRLPTNGAKVVPLGARNMDLLIVLVEQANEVVAGEPWSNAFGQREGPNRSVRTRPQLRRARDLIGPIYSRFTEGLATPAGCTGRTKADCWA